VRGRLRTATWALGLGTAALVACGFGISASAASAQTAFTTKYTQNANQEAQLLQQAEAEGGSSATITALSSTVQTINTQVAALYAADQALVAAKGNVPAVDSTTQAKLQAQKVKLTTELAAVKANLQKDRKDNNRKLTREQQLKINALNAQLKEVDYELAHPATMLGAWGPDPLAGALPQLEASILDLQKAAIHYTNLWITAAKPGATAPGTPVSITGLSYASPTIVVPAAGAASVTDSVYTAPVVKDALGNVLADSGTYAIQGPAGFTGVSINQATGQIVVNPLATAGTYDVTYTQGGVVDAVGILLIP